MDTNLTVKEIQTAIANTFNVRKNVFVPNVSWGYFKTHEADLVSIENHYLIEYEIKRSWEDFLAIMVNNRIVIGDLYEISEFY